MNFQEDLFSNLIPAYFDLEPDQVADLVSVVHTLYFDSGRNVDKIQKVNALELNSGNYRVSVDGHPYHLKCLSPETSTAVINSQFLIADQLRLNGHPFPRVYHNRQHQIISTDHKFRNWILTHFISGRYFSGQGTELPLVADAIGRLFRDLSTLTCCSSYGINRLERLDPLSVSGLHRTLLAFNKWEEALPHSDYILLSKHRTLIEEAVDQIKIHAAFLNSLQPSLSHIDLHPHNLLIQPGGAPVFLDVESLCLYPPLIAVAFAIYKLVRQYSSMHHQNDTAIRGARAADAAFVMCEQIARHSSIANVTTSLMAIAALAEVCRRLSFVIHLNLEKRDTRWNRVLPYHLCGLSEIPIIFSRFS